MRMFALDAQSETIHMQKKSREQYFNGCFKWPFLPTNVINSCVWKSSMQPGFEVNTSLRGHGMGVFFIFLLFLLFH